MMRTTCVRILASCALLAVSSASVGAQTTTSAAKKETRASATIRALLPDCFAAGGTAASMGAFADDSKKGGFDLANLDRSVSPCADFYQFANGGGGEKKPIPGGFSRGGSVSIFTQHKQHR